MFAVDSSTLVAFLQNESGKDIDLFMESLLSHELSIPAVAITEVISNPNGNVRLPHILREIRELPVIDGYWQRAGMLRLKVLKHKLKANIADTLIAQSCIDHGVALITRDADFRHFSKHGGLKLAVR